MFQEEYNFLEGRGASMYHSITFYNGSDSKNTWDDWRLIPTGRPVPVDPTPVYSYVDIPGSDGQKDLSDYLIGRPTLSDRSGAFEFYMTDGDLNWHARRNSIINYFKGRKMMMLLEDEPSIHYEGRFNAKVNPDPSFSKVIIEYRLKPYKYNDNNEEVGI